VHLLKHAISNHVMSEPRILSAQSNSLLIVYRAFEFRIKRCLIHKKTVEWLVWKWWQTFDSTFWYNAGWPGDG